MGCCAKVAVKLLRDAESATMQGLQCESYCENGWARAVRLSEPSVSALKHMNQGSDT